MFALPEIAALQAEKKILQQQSDLNRQMLQMEWVQFKGRLGSFRPRIPAGLPVSNLALVLAPLAGFLLMRRLRLVRGLWLKGLLLWQLAQKLRGILRFIRWLR